MIPAKLDLEIYQGDRYELFFRIRDETWNEDTQQQILGDYIDLTGYTVKSQLRPQPGDSSLSAEFTCTVLDQTVVKGAVLCVLTPAQTAVLPVTTLVWDLQLQQTTDYIETYLAGKVTVTAEVTLDA